MDIAEIGCSIAIVATAIGAGIAYGRLSSKVDLLWQIFQKTLESRLRSSGLFSSSSLSLYGRNILPDELKNQIRILAKRYSAVVVIRKLLPELERIAESPITSFEEVILVAQVLVEEEQVNKPKWRLRFPFLKSFPR